ncbi:hypothetical protein NE865_07443 [Phthorimaea operculella]|nr:hypothetical protein NE865_07443 [Phthorimaea operculella]
MDANAPYSLRDTVPEIAQAEYISLDCSLYPYCGVPYYLPCLQFISRGYSAPAPGPPAPAVAITVAPRIETLAEFKQAIHLNITGPTHIVVIVSPVEGAEVSWCSHLSGAPQEGAVWLPSQRKTYFLTLFDARAARPAHWQLTLHLTHRFSTPPARWASFSVSGHGMAGAKSEQLRALLAKFPEWTARTGWDVHTHLFDV